MTGTRIVSLVTTKGYYRNSKGGRTNHARKSETPVKFVGVDGEGMNVFSVAPNGLTERHHKYVLFGVGDRQIEDPAGLDWKRCFDFAYGLFRPGTAYVGFFLGYDFTQIIATMPRDRAWMLLTKEGQQKRRHKIPGKQPHPVECQDWQFDILGTKRLRIRPKMCRCPYPSCKCKHAPWMYICDVGPFFQQSLLSVIDPAKWSPGTAVVTHDEYEEIRVNKERRSIAVLDDQMRHYNRLENAILERVMGTLDQGLHGIGIHLPASKWFGPGQAAQTWLKNIGTIEGKTVRESVPQWFLEAARMSYFGGWFEIMAHGIVEGTCYEYDINSAYPFIIGQLPCLLHGTWTHGEGTPTVNPGELCLVDAQVWSPGMPNGTRGQHIGAMLHRDGAGRISRPMATAGWYWYHELRAAERAKLIKRLNGPGKQSIKRWVKYTPCDCPPPMRSIYDLYNKRLEVGKDTPLGKGAKTVYNSAYGKFAQSIGEPIFGNPVYASLITAGCRTMILDAIATHPGGQNAVVMVATDAVFFLDPHPQLPISNACGDWDYKERRNLTLFKPGVYWDDEARKRISTGGNATFKARGIRASDFVSEIARIDTEFKRWGTSGTDGKTTRTRFEFPSVEFPSSFSMTTALQALRQNAWERAGRVQEGIRLIQDSDPTDKRDGLYRDTYNGRTLYRSRPHYGLEYVEENGVFDFKWVPSQPYSKRFGMDDPFSDEYKEQFGVTEDGYTVDVIAQLLKDQ